MIPRALNAIGLMRVSEHDEAIEKANGFLDYLEAEIKGIADVIEAQAEEITHLKVRLHYAEPRAEKWDNYLKRSRDRKEASKHRTTKKKGE